MDFFNGYFSKINKCVNSADVKLLDKAVDLILSATEKKKKLIIIGNGGSAAIASHSSVDLTKNAMVRAINFNEADLITCFANDYGYEKWVEKAIEFYADAGDVVILISSSGRSKNIINGALKSKELGLKLITFSGFDSSNPLKQTGDINFWLDNDIYNIVESTHQIWLLAVVDKIIKIKNKKGLK